MLRTREVVAIFMHIQESKLLDVLQINYSIITVKVFTQNVLEFNKCVYIQIKKYRYNIY